MALAENITIPLMARKAAIPLLLTLMLIFLNTFDWLEQGCCSNELRFFRQFVLTWVPHLSSIQFIACVWHITELAMHRAGLTCTVLSAWQYICYDTLTFNLSTKNYITNGFCLAHCYFLFFFIDCFIRPKMYSISSSVRITIS